MSALPLVYTEAGPQASGLGFPAPLLQDTFRHPEAGSEPLRAPRTPQGSLMPALPPAPVITVWGQICFPTGLEPQEARAVAVSVTTAVPVPSTGRALGEWVLAGSRGRRWQTVPSSGDGSFWKRSVGSRPQGLGETQKSTL